MSDQQTTRLHDIKNPRLTAVLLLAILAISVATTAVSARRVDASPKPVLRRLLPSLAFMVLLLIVGAGALLWQLKQKHLVQEINADISRVSSDLHMALDQQASGLSQAGQSIVASSAVQKALRERDTDRLLADWRPVFETLNRENHLTHFYFFDASRICLLRVHNPEKRGDRIDLVVDDVKEQRNLATTMLKKLHYNVESVSSGEEALVYMQAHPVDLMVLDMIMDPGMDGLDTYRSILEIRPNQKAIIVSGFSESERVSAAQALGAGAYVRKPYVMEKLGLAVRRELELAPS